VKDQIVFFNCLGVYHKSPDSGERQNKSGPKNIDPALRARWPLPGREISWKNVLILFCGKSTPSQNRQLDIVISHNKHVDDFVGELTFCNKLIGTFCEILFLQGSDLDAVPGFVAAFDGARRARI
jgi:hypothetical protein